MTCYPWFFGAETERLSALQFPDYRCGPTLQEVYIIDRNRSTATFRFSLQRNQLCRWYFTRDVIFLFRYFQKRGAPSLTQTAFREKSSFHGSHFPETASTLYESDSTISSIGILPYFICSSGSRGSWQTHGSASPHFHRRVAAPRGQKSAIRADCNAIILTYYPHGI